MSVCLSVGKKVAESYLRASEGGLWNEEGEKGEEDTLYHANDVIILAVHYPARKKGLAREKGKNGCHSSLLSYSARSNRRHE